MDFVNRCYKKYHPAKTNDDHPSKMKSQVKFRFVDKNGDINVIYPSFKRVKHLHSNLVLYIMQADWCLVLTFVLLSFIISWFYFALLYFLISIEHGDFTLNEEEHISLDKQQINSTRSYLKIEREKCVQDVHNFLSALLFSIETQHTIGYGSRYITTECMGGILVLTLQSSLGYLLQVIVTQIVFTKLSRPTGKTKSFFLSINNEENIPIVLLGQSQYIVFSNYALIARRNDQLTLTFRIGNEPYQYLTFAYLFLFIANLSTSQLIFASVRLLMIRQRRTLEGETIPHEIYDMELTHLCNGQLFFPRPTIIEHIINSRSPLYGIQRSTLETEHFEIIAIIEGCFDHTGFSCHYRTSYLPNELLWGYQFSPCNLTLSGYDYEKFNDVQVVNTLSTCNSEDEELNDTGISNQSIFSPNLSNEKLRQQNSADYTDSSIDTYSIISSNNINTM